METTSPRPQRTRARAPRVLFVSHEASRTGAPMMFLHFLRWVGANTDLDFEILLLDGGPLVDDFAAVAPVTLVEALGRGSASYLEAGIARAGFPHVGDRMKVARTQRAVRDLCDFDAIYLNSTTSALALRVLPEVPPFVFSHIHELDSAFTYWFPEHLRELMLERTDHFITCADAVSRHLIGARGVSADKISCHYEFVEPPVADLDRAGALRASYGIDPTSIVVGGSGVQIWRKGPDLFVQAAAALARRRPDLDVHFVWVGGPGDEVIPLEHDIDRLGLRGRVHFVGEVAAPADLFANFDLFCLTSREDPYPLVMLESAALGVPVVSFANGGVVEFAGDQCSDARRAVIVPYLDVEAMARAVEVLCDDEEERRAIGRRGQQRVLDEHTIEVGAAGLYHEVMAHLEGTPPPPARPSVPTRTLAIVDVRADDAAEPERRNEAGAEPPPDDPDDLQEPACLAD